MEEFMKKKKKVYPQMYRTAWFYLQNRQEAEDAVQDAVLAAYEKFGKRCGEPGYIKLGSILSQNLKKGAKGLQELLEQEAETGFEDRKHAARKLGEEAGTKLLFPMMLMLAIVLVVLTVPAVMSF